jgi:hypothetical protein
MTNKKSAQAGHKSEAELSLALCAHHLPDLVKGKFPTYREPEKP